MSASTAYWTALEAHFHALADLDAAGRKAYLSAHCQEPALRKDLEELLHSDTDARTGVSALIAEASDTLLGAGITPGETFGPWRVLRLIAEGGMGAVFLAERADGQFERRVALKVLRGALAGEMLTARLRHERQILAGLRHPHIATLLDGGTSDRGLPYLVMEYIDGLPIDQYCTQNERPISDRLRLVQKICGAVQFAHQQLIVHRDIKPGNILVDRDGEPSLLDFGIAKLLDSETHNGAEAPLTRAGERLLTLEYASPEQIQGKAVGTASDVFSLGVLLHELLTGQSPFRKWRDEPLALQQAICQTDPPRPSEALDTLPVCTPQQASEWRRRLRGDLDHIVFKAMRKEPAERYSSAAAMAEDIQRFLDNQPIQARRGSRRYVLGKFFKRNALMLGSMGTILVIITALISYYTQRLMQARDAAEEVSTFMVDIFRAANTNTNRPDVLARDVLDEAARRVESELDRSPLIKAALLRSIGESFGGIRLNDRAETLLRQALSLMRQESAPNDPALAETLSTLGVFLIESGKHDEAEALHREALRIYREQYGPDDLRVGQTLVKIEQIIGQSRHDTAQERFDNLEEAKRILRLHGRERSEAYIVATGAQGSWRRQRFEMAQADALVTEQTRLSESVYGPEHVRAAFKIENSARQKYLQGDYREATPLFERTIRIIEQFKGPSHLDMDWSLYFLARIEREMGHHERALALMKRLVAQETATPQTADNRYLARGLCGQALVLADAGELDAAQGLCKRGKALMLPTIAHQKRVHMDSIHEALGIIALARGDVDTALQELGAMATLLRQEPDPGQTDTPLAIGLHASALAAAGRHVEAEALFAESLHLAAQRYGKNYPTRGRVLLARAFSRERRGQLQAAQQDRERAAAIFQLRSIKAQNADWTMPTDDRRGE